MRAAPLLALILSSVTIPGLHAQGTKPEFFFKKNDVIVVMGDSITEQRLYSNYLELWSVTRFPHYNLVFRNVGIGGDRSTGGNSRFKRDVLGFQPTVLTVDFGMNDGSYKAFGEATFNPYMKGLQGIADQAKAAKIRVAWITPQPTEQANEGTQLTGYNLTLEKFSEGVGEIAKKNDGLFVDQFHPYLAVMNKAREKEPKVRIMAGDAVHPGPPGQSVMAASILKGMNFPREVSNVTIDVASKDASTENCKVSGLKFENGVRFERLDQALPFFPEKARPILKWTPLLEEMNHYGLQVKGLAPGDYDVLVGGKKVASHSADALAKGVNLADAVLTTGPIADQVNDVVKAVTDKTNFYHDDIYRCMVLFNAKHKDFANVAKEDLEPLKKKLFEERMAKMPEKDAAIRKALELKPVLFEIVAVKK